MKTLFPIFFAAIFLTSCGLKSDKKEEVSTTPSEVNSTSGTALINPPHGQPGHDCAVPEGAPLPQSGAIQAQPQPQSSAPVKPEVQKPTVDMSRSLKVNPAHGQPNHRCDIAVGAPLG